MPNKFQVKRTTVSGRTPNTTNSSNTTFIDTGELALNIADGKLFTSNGSAIIEFGTGTPVYDANGALITLTYVTQITNGPAFSAYGAANTSIPFNTWTKIAFDTESFDTNNCFANSRFTPSVSGYYQLNATISTEAAIGANALIIALFKNGSEFKRGDRGSGNTIGLSLNQVVVANTANSDYFEVYAIHNHSTLVTEQGSSTGPTFSGAFVRGV